MDSNKDKEIKRNIADLAETAAMEEKTLTDKSKDGYNFVGSVHSWTTEDEQQAKVKEIEKVTKQHVNHVNTFENNNKGRMDLKNLDK